MPEKQKKFIDTINKLMPNLTDLEQEKLLAFGEGLVFMADRRERRTEAVETGA